MDTSDRITLEGEASIEAAQGEQQYPSVSMVAYGGGPIRVKGYKHPVVVDLEGLEGTDRKLPLLMGHDHGRVVGHGEARREQNTLVLDGVIGAENEDSKEVLTLAKSGFPWKASIGAEIRKIEEVRAGRKATVNGQEIVGPITIARRSYLLETSFVAVPADSSTSAAVAATNNLKEQTDMDKDFQTFIEASGYDAADLSESQLNPLRVAYDNQRNNDADVPSSIDQVLEAARQKAHRANGYSRIIEAAMDKGMGVETAEKLVEAAKSDNLSETEFELQVLRLSRHQGSTSVPSKGKGSAAVIEAALGMAVGLDEADFAPEVLEAAHSEFKHGIGLGEVLQMAAAQNGHRNVSARDTRALLQAAFAPVQANSSTYDVAGILSNIGSKAAQKGYQAVEAEWRKIASIKPVSDLKEHKAYSLTGDMSFQPVGAGGELKHAELGEEEYSNAAETYGRMFAITRRDILNDDLKAFSQIRSMLGRGGALAINKVVWTEWLDNAATFWTAARSNFLSGANTALDIDSLSAAVTAFEEQVDPDGNPLGLMPSVLVVPSALKVQGMRITSDSEIRIDGSTAKTQYFVKNPWAGQFSLCSSQYLNNAKIPGGSQTHWWLAAASEDTPSIEVVFLNGRQAPSIENANADFNTLGIQMRGYFDFGAAKQNHRASVMSAGA